MTGLRAALLAAAMGLVCVEGAAAQSTARTEFRGDAATESATAVEAKGLAALKGLKTVIIPQFTVEFVEHSDGLSSREEKRQDYVYIDYRIAPMPAAEQQAIADQLYARWADGLRAQGLTVVGPAEALAMAPASKLAAAAKPSPAAIRRSTGDNLIYSAGGAGYLMPRTALGEARQSNAAAGAADTGAAVAQKVGGRIGGMFGLARGLGKIGSGLGNFRGAWNYAEAENALAKQANAAVMTVRLVVGLRDIDMASRGFGLFRGAGSYDGKPRLVVMGDASEVTIATPAANRRAEIMVPKDLVFSEDLLKDRLALSNNAGTTAGNIASRAMFAGAALGGGSAAINQRHNFTATPDTTAYRAAVVRNLTAVEDIFLRHLAPAW
ncbi:hypothetical protein [Sphingomonas sp. Y38-1Y]|uniref:hypothetical protein n=1 Tax=Sphingomonas sp. Y38-1Y TaxID=3078265 RepID=UPI0028E38A24|nr:hypothetical protein [Sphingomonas sp. Y38-1Y]